MRKPSRKCDLHSAKAVLINRLRDALIKENIDPDEFDFPDPLKPVYQLWQEPEIILPAYSSTDDFDCDARVNCNACGICDARDNYDVPDSYEARVTVEEGSYRNDENGEKTKMKVKDIGKVGNDKETFDMHPHVYLDDDFKEVFIADESEMCFAASLVDRKDVTNESYKIHQKYPSGHYTIRKLNRKIALALCANKIKRGPRRLPMARGMETTEMRYDRKRKNAGIKSKDLVWLYNLRRSRKWQCPAKLPRNWKDRYNRFPAKPLRN
ncbi:hypothetical protein HELRODRAFT_162965 [Helobdella robusta]|uniref:Uncharacterized protein n=1 Tax=Helobdella robusta TaxID=6412 RepID=T1ETG0_HELRO|nr:hypothetical protein HELRODRAFT_162965 [Helobdella robusta]ESN99417.1 hypothetical protein HELRODRAFT_162965 [Helobdella robusta]